MRRIPTERDRRLTRGMSATTGYFVAGTSWLHHRNPLTKLLALALVLLAAFLLPPFILVVLLALILLTVWSAGLFARRSGRCASRRCSSVDPRRERPVLPGRQGHRREPWPAEREP